MTSSRARSILVMVWSSAVIAVSPLLVADCSSTASAPAKDVLVKIAYDTCSEVLDAATDLDPTWVALLCQSGANTIKVLLPREQWHAIKASRLGGFDAGPGK